MFRSDTDSGPKGGTLKVVVDMPHFSGLNAGSNAVDGNNVNRALSDLLVLDNTGKKSIILHMNGKDTFFEGGTVLTVYFNVWKGDQSNNDYKCNGRKTVTIDGNTTITFTEDGCAQSYLHNKKIVLDNDRNFYFNRKFKYTAKKGDKLNFLMSKPCESYPDQECWCVEHEKYGIGCSGAMYHLLEPTTE